MVVDISLPAAPVQVSPGDAVQWPLAVRNSGPTVRVRLTASGRGADWLSLPDVLVLEPGEHRQVQISVHPPAAAGPEGAVVQVVVRADTDDGSPARTAASVLVLAAHACVSAGFELPSGAMLRRASLPVVVRGEGTQGVDVVLTATSTAPCSVSPARVAVRPGGVARAQVQVTAPLLWWGEPREVVVHLAWVAGDAAPGEATTTLSQRPVLRGGTVLVLAATLAFAVMACLLVLKVVR